MNRTTLVSLICSPVIDAFVRTLGFQRTKSILQKCIPKTSAPSGTRIEFARDTALKVKRGATHRIYVAPCLSRSLLVWTLLGRKGIKSQIRFGVARSSQNRLRAHAWVEVDGVNISDPDDVERFEPLNGTGP